MNEFIYEQIVWQLSIIHDNSIKNICEWIFSTAANKYKNFYISNTDSAYVTHILISAYNLA